ncbi:hypothetical protein D3C84_815050 [compost metagenome]
MRLQIIVKVRQHAKVVLTPLLNLIDNQYTLWRGLAGHTPFDVGQQVLKIIHAPRIRLRPLRLTYLLQHGLPPAGFTVAGDMEHGENTWQLNL